MLRFAAAAILVAAALPLCSQPCDPLPALSGRERGIVSESARNQYRADRDAHPGDPMFATQYARALTGADSAQAIKQLDAVLAEHPDYAPAHLQLALIYNSDVFFDASKLKANLEAYWNACPDSIEGASYIARAGGEDFMLRAAAHLRSAIEKRDDDRALAAYRQLWTVEFKVTPLADQQSVRDRIRSDVARLRRQDLSKHPFLLGELSEAYKLLGDTEGAKWVESQRASHPGTGRSAAVEAIASWRRDHPMHGDFREYNEQVAKQSEEWIRQWPDDPFPRMERFNALRGMQDAALEDQVKAAEEWIRVYEAHPGTGAAPYNSVAAFYNSHNMHYDELPGLVEKALKEVKSAPPPAVSDLYKPAIGNALAQHNSEWATWLTAASVYLELKRYDDARKILNTLGASLNEVKLASDASEGERNALGFQQRQYWDDMARLAHAENHRLDEMAYLRAAGLAAPFPAAMNGEPYWKAQTRQIWKELGGSEEGYAAWIEASGTPGATEAKPAATRPATVSTAGHWTTMDKPLPEFHFADFSGKTWTNADLKGKTTLINLWATWCGPCVAELPHLQTLYEKLRDRSDLQIVTFNVDDNPGLIAPFLTEHKYTFPVLATKEYIDRMLGHWSIPRNWIIDSAGTLRSESIGFGTNPDKWTDDVLQMLEKTK